MIEFSHVTKRYGGATVVDDVSLQVPRGGITSLIGPNGAGKSTLLSMAARLLPMDAGTIAVDGLDVCLASTQEIATRMAILRQDNHVALRLTVRELVAFGRYPHSRGRLTALDKAHVDRAIEHFNLGPLAHRYLDQLSGGQRQRAFVAMVFCQDTDYVLLDEPLNNLDMAHAVEMMRLLRHTVDEFGKTVVLVLHDINFASVYSDRIVAMKDGVIAIDGPPCDVLQTVPLRSIYDLHVDVHEIDGNRIGVYYA